MHAFCRTLPAYGEEIGSRRPIPCGRRRRRRFPSFSLGSLARSTLVTASPRCRKQGSARRSGSKPVSVTDFLQLKREFRIGARQIGLRSDFFRSLLGRGRLAVRTGSPSSFLGLPLLWSQPHALFVPGSCSMTRKHISSAASAQLLLSATAGDLLTTYIHVSIDLPYPVTKALQNFTKKGLVQDRSVPRY